MDEMLEAPPKTTYSITLMSALNLPFVQGGYTSEVTLCWGTEPVCTLHALLVSLSVSCLFIHD